MPVRNRITNDLETISRRSNPNEVYLDFILRNILIESRSTIWVARQLGSPPEEVLRDFNAAITSNYGSHGCS